MEEFNNYNARTRTQVARDEVAHLTTIESAEWNTLQAEALQLSTKDFEKGCHWRPGFYSNTSDNSMKVVTQQYVVTIDEQLTSSFSDEINLSAETIAIVGSNPFLTEYGKVIVPSVTFSVRGAQQLITPSLSSLTQTIGHALNDDPELAMGRFSYGVYNTGVENQIGCWANYWTAWRNDIPFPAGTYCWDFTFLVFVEHIYGVPF